MDGPKELAAYRDAVLWTGALIMLSPSEAVAVCRKVLSRRGGFARLMIARGLFVLDDGSGALLSVPRVGGCPKLASAELRSAGLKSVASRLTRAARRS